MGGAGRFAFAASVAFSALGSVAACSTTAPARPQLVIVLDTDAPVVGQLAEGPGLSADAAIDTVRVDVMDTKNVAIELRDLVVPEKAGWPISFGVALTGPVRLRIRAFRGRLARPGTLGDAGTLESPPEITIERIVDLDSPTSGVRRVLVKLAADCLGVQSSFLDPATTCIDADHRAASPRDAIVDLAGDALPPTSVGTWSGAFDVPCAKAPAPGRMCIPGGFSVLGDLDFSGVDDIIISSSVPLHPVLVSPFHLDETEFTVGRLRALVQKGVFTGPQPTPRTPSDFILAFCTWLGPNDPANDALPVNCLDWSIADRACRIEGGTLPSEAQWEHAARGRGRGLLYPWGNQAPTCCSASGSRKGPAMIATECAGSGIEPVGSHRPSASCNGIGDVSRDGVLDLGGSVGEAMRDKSASFSDRCWRNVGIVRDPVCVDDGIVFHARRGGGWNEGLAIALTPLRLIYPDNLGSPTAGFRCAYPGGAP